MICGAPTIYTERLVLRDITEQDTDLIVKWRSNPKVYKYFLSPHPINKEEHLNWYHEHYIYNADRYDLMAIVKDTGKEVGVFGIKKSASNLKEAEVSYILAPDEQGKGYATEAILELMKYVKTVWNCTKAVAEIHKENHESIQFAERLGYRCVYLLGDFGVYEKVL